MLKLPRVRYLKHFLIIFLFTTASVLIAGYRFGDGDQNSHIPFLLKTINPNLYPNNDFIELRQFHYSYFWLILSPIIKLALVDMEIVFFLVFFLSIFLLFQAYYALIYLLTKNARTSYLGLFLFIIPAFSFSIIPTHETYLVNRTLALPIIVFSIKYFLDNRYIKSFILLALAYNIHVISATFVLLLFAAYFFLNLKKNRLGKPLYYLLIFLILSTPVLFWKFTSAYSSLDLSINYEWYKIISNGALGHIFHLFDFNPPTIILSLLGLGNTFVFIWIYKKKLKEGGISIIDQKLKSFFLAIYLILFLAVITSEFFPITIAIQFQLSRIGTFIPILSFPYFFSFLHQQQKKGAILKSTFNYLVFITSLSAWLIPSYIILITKGKKWLKKFILLLVLTLVSFLVHFLINSGEWKPGIYLYIENSPWYRVQLWAKKNTKIDSIFITPVDKWGHHYPDFMLGSQRPTLVTLGELMEIAFHPYFSESWKKRFKDVVPGALEKFAGNFLQNKKIAKEFYNKNSTQNFVELAKKYKASYAVVEKPKRLHLKKVYENEGYLIYKF